MSDEQPLVIREEGQTALEKQLASDAKLLGIDEQRAANLESYRRMGAKVKAVGVVGIGRVEIVKTMGNIDKIMAHCLKFMEEQPENAAEYLAIMERCQHKALLAAKQLAKSAEMDASDGVERRQRFSLTPPGVTVNVEGDSQIAVCGNSAAQPRALPEATG